MRLIAVVALAAFGSLGARAPAPGHVVDDAKLPPVSVHEVLRIIDSLGAHGAAHFLFAKFDTGAYAGCGGAIFDSIGTGDSLWLVVARRLAPAVDACSGEGMAEALQHSLSHAPRLTLRMLETPFGLRALCDLDFVDAPNAKIEKYYQMAVASVRAMPEGVLKRERVQCLDLLQKGHTQLNAPPP